jgi:Arc/MetJ-type ribon-helix-helix transcriptional regulator
MRTISLHVPESDYAEFKSLAAQDDRPVAELIREAMRRWLAERRRNGGSLTDVQPIDCGAVLRPFDRAEVVEEMFDR